MVPSKQQMNVLDTILMLFDSTDTKTKTPCVELDPDIGILVTLTIKPQKLKGNPWNVSTFALNSIDSVISELSGRLNGIGIPKHMFYIKSCFNQRTTFYDFYVTIELPFGE